MLSKFHSSHPTFCLVSKPTASMIGHYETILPPEIIELWSSCGFGTFMDGYLKLVNPVDYESLLKSAYLPLLEPTVVFGVTAFGDLLLWERQWITQINLRKGCSEQQGNHVGRFFDIFLSNWKTTAPALDAHQFLPALERLGPCAFDECYGYFPALALGGSEKVENLQKVKLREHLSLLSQMVGVIE